MYNVTMEACRRSCLRSQSTRLFWSLWDKIRDWRVWYYEARLFMWSNVWNLIPWIKCIKRSTLESSSTRPNTTQQLSSSGLHGKWEVRLWSDFSLNVQLFMCQIKCIISIIYLCVPQFASFMKACAQMLMNLHYNNNGSIVWAGWVCAAISWLILILTQEAPLTRKWFSGRSCIWSI